MRVSANKNDPGYTPHSLRARVYFDGVLSEHSKLMPGLAFTADEEMGEVEYYPWAGSSILVENDRPVVRVAKGRVQIVLPAESSSEAAVSPHANWRPTFKAVIDLQPVEFRGGNRECLDWGNSLFGQPIMVKDKNGMEHVVGVVTGYRTERLP